MSSIHRYASCFALSFALTIGASDAEEVPGYGTVNPVLIQKNESGLLSREASRLLSEVTEEITEHGALRAWVEANIRYNQWEPTDPAYARQARRITALQHRIVSNLTSAMPDLHPAEVYPSEGPFVAVTVNEAGIRALVADRDVQAICVLVPAY